MRRGLRILLPLLLLAGLPTDVPGATVNRLCGSGMDAVGIAARAIKAGEQDLVMAGGVESMSRAPFVMAKATTAFSRNVETFDTTIGWRFVNKLMKQQYGVDSMPETGENVAEDFEISRQDQDRFSAWSQSKAAAAIENGVLAISGEKKTESEEEKKGFHLMERRFGSFHRTVTLPRKLDSSKAEASFGDGVLAIRIPRSEEAKPRELEIK